MDAPADLKSKAETSEDLSSKVDASNDLSKKTVLADDLNGKVDAAVDQSKAGSSDDLNGQSEPVNGESTEAAKDAPIEEGELKEAEPKEAEQPVDERQHGKHIEESEQKEGEQLIDERQHGKQIEQERMEVQADTSEGDKKQVDIVAKRLESKVVKVIDGRQHGKQIEQERMELDDWQTDTSEDEKKQFDKAAKRLESKVIKVIDFLEAARVESMRSTERRSEQQSDERVETFEAMRLSSQLLQNLRSSYIERPNSLQSRVLPFLLKNRTKSIYVRSRSHSGKKTAFLINALHRINPDLPETQVVIIAPTTELVYYIAEAARDLAQHMNVRVFEMTKDHVQEKMIHHHLIISTLGSFLYLRRNKATDLQHLSCMVFDEVDLLTCTNKNTRNMYKILNQLQYFPFQRLFFSTSFCNHALKIVQLRFAMPNVLICDHLDPSFSDDFLQFMNYSRTNEIKKNKLVTLLKNTIKKKIVIYTLQTKTAEMLTGHLHFWNIAAVCTTHDSNLCERLKAIEQFNSSKEQIVLCTNYPVCHGISLDDVSVVVNYDLPSNHDFLPVEYLHYISTCNTANRTPAFVVNMVDSKSVHQMKRVESYYQIRMIDLKLSDNDH